MVTLNKPPYIPIPVPKGLIKRLFHAKKLVEINPNITTLENKIDLSFLNVKAFESNNKINNDISM